MSVQEHNMLEFLVALVSEFAARIGITQDVAYDYKPRASRS